MSVDRRVTRKPSGLTDDLLQHAAASFPAIDKALAKWGSWPLLDYVTALAQQRVEGLQSGDDLLDGIRSYTETLFGETVARQVAEDLAATHLALTANHLGCDCFAQSLQGTLAFALPSLTDQRAQQTVLVLSVGNIPLNNLTYPRGVLCYKPPTQRVPNAPCRIPVFPERLKHAMAGAVGPFNRAMIQKGLNQIAQGIRSERIAADLGPTLKRLLSDTWQSLCHHQWITFSHQATVLNHLMWNQILRPVAILPKLVFLELEKITIRLLLKDLQNHQSLAYRVFFNPRLRRAVLENLNGTNGCWDLHRLGNRLHGRSAPQGRGTTGGGTVFFWGCAPDGQRIPLCLAKKNKTKQRLWGRTGAGQLWEMPFGRASLKYALESHRLMPSLFTCFLALSLARGLTCVGGYFQADYLPTMQRGLVQALQETGQGGDITGHVAKVRSDAYLSGMLMVMGAAPSTGLLWPAGPIEILAAGGLTPDDIARMARLSVRDAHLAGLFETAPDLAGIPQKHPDWRFRLAKELYKMLGDRIVLKT